MVIDVEVKKPKIISVEMSNVRINQNEPNLQDKTVSYTANGTYNIPTDEGFDGIRSVEATVDVQPDLEEASVTYTENGTYTITPNENKDGLSEVDIIVDVPEPPAPQYQSKTVTPKTEQKTITPSEGYNALSSVIVNAVTADIDSDITAENIKKDVEILGVIGTYEGAADTIIKAMCENTALSITIPQGTTSIRSYAFCGFSNLNALTIPEGVTSIGQNAFYNCSSLTTLNIPDSVETLSYGAFESVGNITNSIVLTNVLSIPVNCFKNCYHVPSIDLVAATTIAASAFMQCHALNALIIRNNGVCTLANVNAFTGTQIASGTGYIYVPDALVNSYKSATNWSTYAAQIRGLSQLPTI